MNISNARYTLDQGYPLLTVDVDGDEVIISSEQKPTLLRHGLVAVDGGRFSAEFGGRMVQGVTDSPYLLKLAIAFGLDCYYGRFQVGSAHQNINLAELLDLGNRLAPAAGADSPSWLSVVSRLWPLRVI
jgi:hypothetical protein